MSPAGSAAGARTGLDWAVAGFALLSIAVHDAVHVTEGRYWDTLWVCNVSAVLVAPAVLLRSGLLATAALTWLVPGTIVWLVDAVVSGANLMPTSYPVHIGGTLASAYAVRRSGFAPRGWVAALATLLASVLASRLFLPEHANVNAAHAIPKGWGFLGSTRSAFALTGSAIVAATCWLGSALSRRIAN